MYSFILVIKQGVPFPLLDVALSLSPKNYRLSILSHRSTLDIGPAILCSDAEWLDHEHAQLRDEIVEQKSKDGSYDEDYFASRIADIEKEARRQDKEALATYGMLEGTDARVGPMRRALAVWGLTADDRCSLDARNEHRSQREERDRYMAQHSRYNVSYSW